MGAGLDGLVAFCIVREAVYPSIHSIPKYPENDISSVFVI